MPNDALMTPALKTGITECIKCIKSNIYDPRNLLKLKLDVGTCEDLPRITKPLIHTCVQARIAAYISAPCKGACRIIQPKPQVTKAGIDESVLIAITSYDRFSLGNSFI